MYERSTKRRYVLVKALNPCPIHDHQKFVATTGTGLTGCPQVVKYLQPCQGTTGKTR